MKALSDAMTGKRGSDNTGSDHGSSRLSEQSKSPSPAARPDLYHQPDSSLVDDYAERSRIRIQELKRALTRRPSWRKRPRPMSAVFPGTDDKKPGNEVIYSNIAKYIENQKKKALAQQMRVSSIDNKGQLSAQSGSYRRALTPDFEASGNPDYDRKSFNDNARPRSANPWIRPNTPERYQGVRTYGDVRSSATRIPEVSPGVEHHHAKSTSLSEMSDRKLIRSLRQSLESNNNEEDEDCSEKAHNNDRNGPNIQFQQGKRTINGSIYLSQLNPTDEKYCSRLLQKAKSQPSTDGRTSENSSIRSEVNYDKCSMSHLGETNRNIDENSFDTHSMDNSSIVSSAGNGKAPSSIDSENRSELSCARSIDSEVARYTKNMSKEELIKHSRGVYRDDRNGSNQSNISFRHNNLNEKDSKRNPIREIPAGNGWSYSSQQFGTPSHRSNVAEPDRLIIRYNYSNNSPSVSDISNTKESVHSSLQDVTLTALKEGSDYSVNARTRPDISKASEYRPDPSLRSESNRYPWQSGSIAERELCHSYRFMKLPMEYERIRGIVGGQVGGLGEGTRENKQVSVSGHRKRTPSEVKSKNVMQHARSFSSPVQMMDQSPPLHANGVRSQSNQVIRPQSVSSQRASSRIPNKNESHFNRLMSRIPSNRPPRPHSVAIAERPPSRQSDGTTRRSPFLWDSPLSRESRQKRLSKGDSYGRAIYVQGTALRRPSSTDICSGWGRSDNSELDVAVSDSETNDLKMFPYLSSVTKKAGEESKRLNEVLTKPKLKDNRYTSNHYPMFYHNNKSSHDEKLNEITYDAKSNMVSNQNGVHSGNLIKSESNTDKSRQSHQLRQPDIKIISETDLDLATTESLEFSLCDAELANAFFEDDEGTPKESECDVAADDNELDNEEPNQELATHVARLFKQQNTKTEENGSRDEAVIVERYLQENREKAKDVEGSLDRSRDKSIEEIEQMVKEIEQQGGSEVISVELEPDIPEEPEAETKEKTPLALVTGKLNNCSEGLERNVDEQDSDSTFQQLRGLNVITDHSFPDSTTRSVKLIYVSKYYSQKSMSVTVLQKNCSFVLKFKMYKCRFDTLQNAVYIVILH